jgi:hypothetical protein
LLLNYIITLCQEKFIFFRDFFLPEAETGFGEQGAERPLGENL